MSSFTLRMKEKDTDRSFELQTEHTRVYQARFYMLRPRKIVCVVLHRADVAKTLR